MRRKTRPTKRVRGDLFRLAAGGAVGFALLFAGNFCPENFDSPLERRANAAEDWRRFLDALDENGYGDLAIDYLKSLQDSQTAPPELAAELDLRLGLATLDALSTAPPSRRDSLVAQARAALEKFLAENPDSPSVDQANAGLGRLLLDEGSRALDATALKDVSDADRERSTTAAKLAFSNAKPYLDAALKAAREKAKTLQESKNARPDDLSRAQGAFLDLTLRFATLQAQTARTFPENSKERRDGLTKARTNFGKIFATFQQYAGGFQARYLEAEIARELGDVEAALGALSELAILPFEPQFYSLKTRSLLLFAEIAVERDDPAALMSVVKKFNDWQDGERLPKAYYSSAEGLRIRLLAVRATIRLEELRRADFDAFAAAGKKTFTDSEDPTYKLMSLKGKTTGSNKIVVFALENLVFVAGKPGPDGAEAQALLKNPLFEGIDLSQYSFAKPASDFAGAVAEARRAVSAYSTALRDAKGAAPELAAEARKLVDESAEAAYSAFQKAFELADDKTSADDLDAARLQFAAICFAIERFEEAFSAADELAKNRPELASAPTAASVALRSLQALESKARRSGADDDELASARQKIAEYADFVVERWSADAESGNANAVAAAAVVQEGTLVQMELAIDAGNVDAARAFLEKIPESSPRRADAELRLGGSFWSAWNARRDAASELDADADSNAENAPATVDALLSGAEKALYDGLQRKIQSPNGVSETDETTIFYVFLLVQVYEAQGKFADAENWLKHPVIGPATFVERKLSGAAPVAENAAPEGAAAPAETEIAATAPSELLDDDFQTAVLATQLSLTLASPERLADAEKIAENLEKLVERSPENASKLLGVYLRLGKRLEERLTALKDAAEKGDASKEAELAAASKGFEAFLKRAAERSAQSGAGYASSRWIADSFLALGRGLSGTLSDPPPQAVEYFAQAGRTYQTILKKIEADTNFAPAESARLAVSLKIVESLRSAGAYTKAFDQAKKLIKEAPNNLDVQLETARTLQSWGRKDPKRYLTAIVGGAPDAKGRNVVWGWNGIIRKLAAAFNRGEKFKEAFYDAYREKTLCRYLYIKKLTDKDEIAKQARDAENDLRRLYQTRPDLGGPATFAKFDSAFKNFQKLRGEKKPIGLRAAAKKNGATPATSAKPQNAAKPADSQPANEPQPADSQPANEPEPAENENEKKER